MEMKVRRRRRNEAFTLMEVLLVLVILVILGSLVGVGISRTRTRAFTDSATSQIKLFEKALKMYEMDVRSYPTSSQGLQALIEPPQGLANESRWRGPYLDTKQLPLDPWDNAYQYQAADGGITISSAGPDGVPNSDDDIIGTSS
jgi:general secretion pathway protein G